MDNRELLIAIEKEIKVLNTHFAKLRNKPGEVHDIDIDVLAGRLKSLYAMVLELETTSAIEAIADEPNELVPEPEIEPEPEPEIQPDPEPEIEPDPEPEIEPDPIPEIEPEPEAGPTTYSKPQVEPGSQSPPEILAKPEPDTRDPAPKLTADLFSGTPTIADAYQAREDKSIAARVAPQSVDDLKRAIGINDKFLFINELFKGSPGEYNEAIEELNTAGSLDKAHEKMDQCRVRYEWAEQSEAYHRLKKIVSAKFNGS